MWHPDIPPNSSHIHSNIGDWCWVCITSYDVLGGGAWWGVRGDWTSTHVGICRVLITLTMDNTAPFSLADLMSDPRFDFLRQFLSNDCEQNQNSNINLFNEATDNPYDDLSIKCNYFDEAQYICEHRNCAAHVCTLFSSTANLRESYGSHVY